MRTVLRLSLLLLTLSPLAAIAQETTGAIEGRVMDSAGEAVASATVVAAGPALIGSRFVVSGQDGFFAIPGLPVGVYELRIGPPDEPAVVVTDVAVRLGRSTNVGMLELRDEAYRVEVVVVTAKTPRVDPTATTVGGNLIADEYRELPVDRSHRDLATLLPHVQASFLGDDLNFAGGTGMENKWYVDGVDVTDPLIGGSAMELPYNFVSEVRVRSGGYQAEFRGAQGGVVDVVTHRGGNDVRGQIFGFFLNDKTVATPRLGIQDPSGGSFSRWDIGAGLSGPVIHDRLWYSAAYNPAFDNEEVEVPGVGILEEERTTHRFAGSLDWLVNDSNDLSISVVGDPGKRSGVDPFQWGTPSSFASPDPLLVNEDRGTVASALKGRHFLGQAVMLQSTVSMVWNRHETTPQTPGGEEVTFWDHETDIASGGILNRGTTDGRDLTLALTASWQLGAHVLKAGAEYRNNSVDIDEDGGMLERFWDPDAGAETYVWGSWHTHGKVGNRAPAAFLQDSWRIGERLRLNLGVRWNGQYLTDSSGDVAITINDQWQPRLGATYLLGDQQRAKIFGSAGRFYQDLSLYAPSALLVEDSSYRVTVYDHDPRVDPSDGVIVYDAEGSVVDDLRGQYFDEITLGYERQVGSHGRLTLRGIYRELGEAIEDSWSEAAQNFVWGNPGRGLVAEYPRPSRDYTALELTYQISGAERYNLLASYVLSRNRGNTTGIFPSDYGFGTPNLGPQWDELEQTVNGHGLLPNDRTHVLNLTGSWRVTRGLTFGAIFAWARGTPLNEFGAGAAAPAYKVFLVPRGTAGRLPDLWDLSLRFTYDLAARSQSGLGARIILDLLHVGNPQEVTNVDQRRFQFQDENGNQTNPNPTYGQPIAYQPPFAVRLGAEVTF